MSASLKAPDTLPEAQLPSRLLSLGWALRRLGLLLVMLFGMIVVLGWLFYAGIDPDEAAAGPPVEQAQSRN